MSALCPPLLLAKRWLAPSAGRWASRWSFDTSTPMVSFCIFSAPLLVIRGSPPGIRPGQRKRRGRSNSRVRTHCSEPEGDGCGDADCREVGMGAAVISGVDSPPIFEPSEHVFDLVAPFVEDGVIGDGDLPIGFRGDAGDDAALGEVGAEPVGVVTLVGQ